MGEHGGAERRRAGALRFDRYIRFGRLCDVAGAALVLDDLWSAVHGGPGACCVGVLHSGIDLAFRTGTSLGSCEAFVFSGPRKFSAGLRDALGVPGVLAVPDYLGRKSFRGNSLVHPAHAGNLGDRRTAASPCEFRSSVFPPSVSQREAENGLPFTCCRFGSRDASGGHVLDGFARVRRRRCTSHVDERAASIWHGRNLARVFHLAVAAVAGSAGPRSTHGRSGAACRRAWINRTALQQPRRVTRRAMRMCAAFSAFWWF